MGRGALAQTHGGQEGSKVGGGVRDGALEEETATAEAAAAGNAALPKRMARRRSPETVESEWDFSGRAGDSGSSP